MTVEDRPRYRRRSMSTPPESRAVIEQLIAARKAAGLTQTAVARQLGITQKRLSDIECGRNDAGLATIARIARAVGLDSIDIP